MAGSTTYQLPPDEIRELFEGEETPLFSLDPTCKWCSLLSNIQSESRPLKHMRRC
jgi:hypothetical protein